MRYLRRRVMANKDTITITIPRETAEHYADEGWWAPVVQPLHEACKEALKPKLHPEVLAELRDRASGRTARGFYCGPMGTPPGPSVQDAAENLAEFVEYALKELGD
jgi:hypothetical protein